MTVRDSAVYDPQQNAWSPITGMRTARNHHGAAVLRGRIFVVGGHPRNLTTNEMYDIAAGTWVEKAPMPTGRSGILAGLPG